MPADLRTPGDDTDIPLPIAVQMLQTVRQIAVDVAAHRADLAAHRAEVLPVMERYRMTMEAHAKAEAAANAEAIVANQRLETANTDRTTAKIKRDGEVVALFSAENVKAFARIVLPFLAGGSGAAWWATHPSPAADTSVIESTP